MRKQGTEDGVASVPHVEGVVVVSLLVTIMEVGGAQEVTMAVLAAQVLHVAEVDAQGQGVVVAAAEEEVAVGAVAVDNILS